MRSRARPRSARCACVRRASRLANAASRMSRDASIALRPDGVRVRWKRRRSSDCVSRLTKPAASTRFTRNVTVGFGVTLGGHATPPPAPVVQLVKDTDGDGITDDKDNCPNEAGPKENNGCPDKDSDGDGVVDRKDKCPDKAGPPERDGCPEEDRDHDGIVDSADKCPDDPEDKDGFEDADGCPDPDNDKDGVLDAADKCPNEPGPADNDGCPKKFEHIVVTQEKIELKQKIFFDTNKTTIQPRSFSLLDEIASVLKSRPTMTVRIEGHTDVRGTHAHNMQLSAGRAESVRQHLVGLGIDPSRMDAKGFGPDQPIETNKTAAGREKNRRVEFFITQQ